MAERVAGRTLFQFSRGRRRAPLKARVFSILVKVDIVKCQRTRVVPRRPVCSSPLQGRGFFCPILKGESTAMVDEEKTTNALTDLGPGEGSKVEHIKIGSDYLRGQIAEELSQDATHFSEAQVQLLKFHGTYQQEDRDARHARKAGEEKAYQFMVRSRIPGGVLTAEQYLIEDYLAARYATGTLRITTRQGVQLP